MICLSPEKFDADRASLSPSLEQYDHQRFIWYVCRPRGLVLIADG